MFGVATVNVVQSSKWIRDWSGYFSSNKNFLASHANKLKIYMKAGLDIKTRCALRSIICCLTLKLL